MKRPWNYLIKWTTGSWNVHQLAMINYSSLFCMMHSKLQVTFFFNLNFFKHLGDSFLSPFTTHQYTSLVQKHPILLKFGAFFYDNLLKTHPICVNCMGTFICSEIAIPKFADRAPQKGQAHTRIPYQCENPLQGGGTSHSKRMRWGCG